jgi:hypothetical protein
MTLATRPLSALWALLGKSLGHDKAEQLVIAAARDLGISGDIDRHQALQVLEKLGGEPGLVGVVARFAAVRIHLGWSNEHALAPTKR